MSNENTSTVNVPYNQKYKNENFLAVLFDSVLTKAFTLLSSQ